MKTVFSTEHIHPRERFAFWHDVARRNVVDHESTPVCRNTFHAELRAGSVGDIGLVSFQNSDMAVSHTRRHIVHANTDELFICRQSGRQIALEQDGRNVVLEAGDITLIDPALPYGARFFKGSEVLILKIPRQRLEARLGKAREMTARAIKPGTTETGLLSATLAMLPPSHGQFELGRRSPSRTAPARSGHPVGWADVGAGRIAYLAVPLPRACEIAGGDRSPLG